MGFLSNMFGPSKRQLARKVNRLQFLNRMGSITAANGVGGRGGAGKGSWNGMSAAEDAANKEYAHDRGAIMQRSQDLHVNNPDLGGFHVARVAQILGAGVKFKHAPRAKEIGISKKKAIKIAEDIDRLRRLHSENGGFDSQRGERWEGKQQERAYLTALVYGCCLIHRVGKKSGGGLLPLSIELIPGSRISTPYKQQGDPLISFGVQYTDAHRTKIAGYHVRRVSTSIGDSFVPDYEWDFLPAVDCSLLDLTEPAGIDQSLPLSTRVTRMMRNRGEFIETAVESARAQSGYFAVTECAEGANQFDVAADDRDFSRDVGFVQMGNGVKMLYAAKGEKVTFNSAKLPEPELADFMDATDERMARGLASSKARFTRQVGSSWAGGRLEDQQDDPIIDQYRVAFKAAWHKVNDWFLEAVWLSGEIEMPGYGLGTKHFWNQFRAEFAGKVDVNPQDTAKASETNMMLRKTSPQREIERTGGDPREILREWAEWQIATREMEKEYGLEEGSLDVLFSGKAVTTQAGDDVGAPQPANEPQPGGADQKSDPPAKKGKGGKRNKRGSAQ